MPLQMAFTTPHHSKSPVYAEPSILLTPNPHDKRPPTFPPHSPRIPPAFPQHSLPHSLRTRPNHTPHHAPNSLIVIFGPALPPVLPMTRLPITAGLRYNAWLDPVARSRVSGLFQKPRRPQLATLWGRQENKSWQNSIASALLALR